MHTTERGPELPPLFSAKTDWQIAAEALAAAQAHLGQVAAGADVGAGYGAGVGAADAGTGAGASRGAADVGAGAAADASRGAADGADAGAGAGASTGHGAATGAGAGSGAGAADAGAAETPAAAQAHPDKRSAIDTGTAAESNMGMPNPAGPAEDLTLRQGPERLTLRQDPEGLTLVGNGMELRGDFAELLPRLKMTRLSQELLFKATRLKGVPEPHTAIDATAGLGEDALLMAAAGYHVLLCEKDPLIAALLADTVARAQEHPVLGHIAARMTVVPGDSIELLQRLDFAPDLVHLDPMFPAKQKNAKTNKKLQMFQQLEAPCDQEEALLDAALAAGPRKIVIKRPLKGPYLAGRKPMYDLRGKTVRYDCFTLAR